LHRILSADNIINIVIILGCSSGVIFDVKHYAVHDGPGIRVTVFLKGCPLRCAWCHSPESQNSKPEIIAHSERCIGCGKCVEVCTQHTVKSPGQIDRDTCNQCGACVENCYAEALELIGKQTSIDEILAEINGDRELIMGSGGGVTVSGGEPLFQPGFTVELLKSLKENGYHTALDTSGYADWSILSEALEYTNLVLYDVKHMDNEKHREFTGVSNNLILENLGKTLEMGKRVWIRVPLIPGVNDDKDHLRELAYYIRGLKVDSTYLLPYHTIGVAKYAALGREYKIRCEPHSLSQLLEIRDTVSGIIKELVVMGIE
jgi:pyruvate formate lyase activating enzyme